jgi:hypothetical protein
MRWHEMAMVTGKRAFACLQLGLHFGCIYGASWLQIVVSVGVFAYFLMLITLAACTYIPRMHELFR